MIKNQDIINRLKEGNEKYLTALTGTEDISPAIREETTVNGQHPYAIIIACSDSRVIPESIFSAGIGDLFVIRVAGNVIDSHQLGSIEYAAAHLHTNVIIVLGHTNCGAVSATLEGDGDGNIRYITDQIKLAIGTEKNPYWAGCLNVKRGVSIIKQTLDEHHKISLDKLDVLGAMYDIKTGKVEWLDNL